MSDTGAILNLSEGRVTKGGQNPPLTDRTRPPAPGGSGSKSERHSVEMLKPGAAVEFGPDDARNEGVIRQCCICGEEFAISYEVVWWSNGERKLTWLNESEVQVRRGERMQIGWRAK